MLDTDLNCTREKLNLSGINTRRVLLLDIKVFPNEIYALTSGTKSAIQMFDKEDGSLIVNIVARELLGESVFFTMDKYKNFFVGDSSTNELKAFSNEEKILWIKNAFEENQAESGSIMGIGMNSNNEVVIACNCNTKCMIRKFSCLKV